MTTADDCNPVQAWLDVVDLPWRATRGELAARYGVSTDNPYAWEIVDLAISPPPLSGMLSAFGFQAFGYHSPNLPPVRFTTHVWVGNDPDENVRVAARQIAHHLGAKPVVILYNTLRVAWEFGAASITLMAWPDRLQSMPIGSNPAHRRDPRLNTACSVEVMTGWRTPLAERELAWLNSFVAMGPDRNWKTAQLQSDRQRMMFAEPMLDYIRELPHGMSNLEGQFGLSADGKALITHRDTLYVIPVAEISRLEVIRVLPAKGGGGSSIVARCVTGYSSTLKDVTITEGERADDLNHLAAQLAAAAGKPLILGKYEYDA